jgi:hypothetical protein
MNKVMFKLIFQVFLKILIIFVLMIQVSESKGTEKKDSLVFKLGGGVGGQMSSLYSGGAGLGLAPDSFLRSDLLFYKNGEHGIGSKMDFGYSQVNLPVENGEIKSDYFTAALVLDYRFSFKNLASSEVAQNISLYIFTGPFVNTMLSSLYYDDYLKEDYNFDSYNNKISYGIKAGFGIDYEFSDLTVFSEIAVLPSITSDIKKVTSNILMIDETSQYSIQLNFGVTYKIFPQKSSPEIIREGTSMSLKKKNKIKKKRNRLKKR